MCDFFPKIYDFLSEESVSVSEIVSDGRGSLTKCLCGTETKDSEFALP